MFYSTTTRGFYHEGLHGSDMPADVVSITEARHRRLFAAQAAGRTIVSNAAGRPIVEPRRIPRHDQLLATAIKAVKREAGRRILAVASLERQANDSALIATAALAIAAAALDGPLLPDEPVEPALARRAKIDAIRTASNRLETLLTEAGAAALRAFNADDASYWP